MFLTIFRTIKFSFQDIFRNIWLSIVTITILVLALFTVNVILVVDFLSKAAIESVKERIDINIYLKNNAEDPDIQALKKTIENNPLVKSVQYISKNDALAAFEEKHNRDPEILSALRELGNNPLSPTLVIKPADMNQFGELTQNLNSIENDLIESRNFDDHKLVLDKINFITSKVRQAGMFISLIFLAITMLLVYNSVRVAIYTHRLEIGIMRLVGASNWFIKIPYFFSSLLYTAIGLGIVTAVFFPFLNLLQPYLETFFVDYQVDVAAYFRSNFMDIFGLEFIGLAAINALASLIAVSKYSKV